jgi:hypothetical protein
MPLQRATYTFRVRLPASRARAYAWATDYRDDDFRMMEFGGRRRVRRLAKDLILLTDSFAADPFDSTRGRRTVKAKLVHLYPDRWAWTSTHVSGPARMSQFQYELTPRGARACELRFTGAQVENVSRTPTAASTKRRARELAREDAALWQRLARALGNEVAGSRKRRGKSAKG